MKRIIIIAALVCGSAHAAFYTGNDLWERLNGTEVQKLIALGYIGGVADSLDSRIVCMPSVSLGQTRDVVKQYLENNPSVRHYSADSLIQNILSSMWPCARKGSTL
jgi:hypothetical protein